MNMNCDNIAKSTRILIICESTYNGNTIKIAKAIQLALKCKLITPNDINTINIDDYDVIGLGSGIKFGKHDVKILKIINDIPIKKKKVFIFSTRCNPFIGKYHNYIKRILIENQCIIIGEFSALGFDATGPFSLIGGFNKGKPNERDIKRAERFVYNLNLLERPQDILKNKNMKRIENVQGCDVYKGEINGETITVYGSITSVNLSKCIGCGYCNKVCPTQVFEIKTVIENEKKLIKSYPIRQKNCVLCKKCMKACPTNSIFIRNSISNAFNVVKNNKYRYE